MMYFIFYMINFILNFTKNEKVYYFILFPLFIFIFGLRYKVGVDWGPYERYFYNPDTSFEYGYYILNRFILFFLNDFKWLILITFTFICLVYFKSIKFFTREYNISLMAWIGIGFLSFGVIRQGIAIALFFWALKYIKKNKKKYILLIVISSLFHNTAILLLPLVFFIDRYYSSKSIIKVLFISLGIYFTHVGLYFMKLFIAIPIIGSKIDFYLNAGGAHSESLGLGVRFIEACILFLICTFFREKIDNRYKWFNVFYNLLVCYLVVYLAFNDIGTIAARSIKYFELAHIILFGFIFSIINNKHLKQLTIMLLFLYLGLRYYMTITGGLSLQSNLDDFLPYQNVLFH